MAGQPTDVEARGTDELHRLREENLRFRDLLIARDAELGALKGQIAALEAGSARVLGLVARVRALLPGPITRRLLSLVRRLSRG
ncbi:MAG TPA: hypothetical protein VGG40_10370 [Solirubrobacterales bacterium]|jgi:hypothetical protein